MLKYVHVLTNYNRCVRMPASIANACAPATRLVKIDSCAAIKSPRRSSRALYVNLACFGGVHIPDVYFAICASRVNISRVGGRGWREMTSDERAKDLVAPESDE